MILSDMAKILDLSFFLKKCLFSFSWGKDKNSENENFVQHLCLK